MHTCVYVCMYPQLYMYIGYVYMSIGGTVNTIKAILEYTMALLLGLMVVFMLMRAPQYTITCAWVAVYVLVAYTMVGVWSYKGGAYRGRTHTTTPTYVWVEDDLPGTYQEWFAYSLKLQQEHEARSLAAQSYFTGTYMEK